MSAITVTVSLVCTNGNFKIPKLSETLNVDQAIASGGFPGILVATNAAQGVNVPNTGLTTLGYTWIKNIDAVAVLDIGPVTGGVLVPFAQLKPGEAVPIRLKAGITWAVKSSIASSLVQIFQLEA